MIVDLLKIELFILLSMTGSSSRALSALQRVDCPVLMEFVPSLLPVNSQVSGRSLLLHAIDHNSVTCLQYLLDCHCDLSQTDPVSFVLIQAFFLFFPDSTSPLHCTEKAAPVTAAPQCERGRERA
jgi:hypothetical protein